MAWTAYNKSNRTRVAESDKMIQYFPGAITTATVAANSTLLITLTAAFQFKGNGPVDVSLPEGATLATGLSLGEAVLTGPASGNYAAGNHPLIIFKLLNSTAAAITPTATDVIASQM